jgi:ABC-type multidrug transport system fused ATPase/permease subunit
MGRHTEKDLLSMSYYLLEMRPYFRQVAGQLGLGSIAGIIMNTAVVLPAILLGQAIDAALALERGAVGAGAAVVERVPPLLMKQIVDEHLKLGCSEGLLWIAVLYLCATAAVQGMGFLTEYLTAIIAQGVLHRLRVRLFAHLQTFPCAIMIAPR